MRQSAPRLHFYIPTGRVISFLVFHFNLALCRLPCSSSVRCILWSLSTILSTVRWWLQEFPSQHHFWVGHRYERLTRQTTKSWRKFTVKYMHVIYRLEGPYSEKLWPIWSTSAEFFTIRTDPKPVNNFFYFFLSHRARVTVTVVRDRKFRTALRTNQIAGFVNVAS